MLETLFGNPNIERVLFYLQRFGEGYPRAIAANFDVPLTPIQQQLRRLEQGSLVVSRLVGRTRVFQINPRYPFKKELEALLATAFQALPETQIKKYYMQRTRPRRQGKP
jgi:hypothetical protein